MAAGVPLGLELLAAAAEGHADLPPLPTAIEKRHVIDITSAATHASAVYEIYDAFRENRPGYWLALRFHYQESMPCFVLPVQDDPGILYAPTGLEIWIQFSPGGPFIDISARRSSDGHPEPLAQGVHTLSVLPLVLRFLLEVLTPVFVRSNSTLSLFQDSLVLRAGLGPAGDLFWAADLDFVGPTSRRQEMTQHLTVLLVLATGLPHYVKRFTIVYYAQDVTLGHDRCKHATGPVVTFPPDLFRQMAIHCRRTYFVMHVNFALCAANPTPDTIYMPTTLFDGMYGQSIVRVIVVLGFYRRDMESSVAFRRRVGGILADLRATGARSHGPDFRLAIKSATPAGAKMDRGTNCFLHIDMPPCEAWPPSFQTWVGVCDEHPTVGAVSTVTHTDVRGGFV